ncbi:DUF928 domain-containing protein [Leptolyngbya ohadii]|uniref:DUF928 domain-containing protein n=1 Tax=Leptolyngbya ohadii TaxID=1962290 RepID=UPI0015C67316|nr:DUF928 domain-containing protein [Leptolyngbya ohadii]
MGRRIIRGMLALALISFLWLTGVPIAEATPAFVPVMPSLVAQSSNGNFFSELVRRVRALTNPARTNRQGRAVPAGRSRGGAGRGKFCPTTPVPAIAIVPSIQATSAGDLADRLTDLAKLETVFGKTTEANPTFWFYVPYAATETLNRASFMLLDEDKHPVFPKPISISFSNTPGIIQFRLPNSYALEIDRLYNWYFSVICDETKPSRNSGVRGWIQRVEKTAQLETSLQSAADYSVYAEQGIWFDLVTDLASRYANDRGNSTYQQHWNGVLEFIQKPELKDAAIVDCCD